MSTHISDDVRDFVSALADGDYLLEHWDTGAYGISVRPTYITVQGGKIKHRYQDLWCGGPAPMGETYRSHRDGRRIKFFPARLVKATDISDRWEALLAEYPAMDAESALGFFP